MSVCLIPARGGSTRIPKKNIKEFLGIPMLSRAIRLAKAAELFERIVVSSDDVETLFLAQKEGAEVHQRDGQLARNEVGTQELAKAVLTELGVSNCVVCVLYPCTPLVQPNDLQLASMMLVARPCSYVLAVGDTPLRDIGNYYMGMAEEFLSGRPLINYTTGLYVMPPERAVDINVQADWDEAVEKYMAMEAK